MYSIIHGQIPTFSWRGVVGHILIGALRISYNNSIPQCSARYSVFLTVSLVFKLYRNSMKPSSFHRSKSKTLRGIDQCVRTDYSTLTNYLFSELFSRNVGGHHVGSLVHSVGCLVHHTHASSFSSQTHVTRF